MDFILLTILAIASVLIAVVKLHFTYNLLFYLVFIALCSVLSYRNIKNGTLSNFGFVLIFLWGILIHVLNIQGHDYGLTAYRTLQYNIPTWGTSLILATKGAIWGGVIYYIISKVFKSVYKTDTDVLGLSAIRFSAFSFCTGTFIGTIDLFIVACIIAAGVCYLPLLIKDFQINKPKFLTELIWAICLLMHICFKNVIPKPIDTAILVFMVIAFIYIVKLTRKMEPNQFTYIPVLPIMMFATTFVLLK